MPPKTWIFIIIFIISNVICDQYGLELELLSIKNNANKLQRQNWQSFQYDLEVEARNGKNDVHVLGTVTLTAVLGQQSEIVFPEITGKNPFAVTRINAGDRACFRLSQITFEHLAEDCYQVMKSAEFYKIHNFNVTLAEEEGSVLYYKWSQHLLKNDDFNSDQVFQQLPADLPLRISSESSSSLSTLSVSTDENSSKRCICQSCTVPIVFAALEAAILLPLILFGAYLGISKFHSERKEKERQISLKQTRPTIMVIRPGEPTVSPSNNSGDIYDDSGVSSVSSLPDHSNRGQQTVYNDAMSTQVATGGQRKPSRPPPGGATVAPETMTKFKSSTVNNASISLKNTLATTGRKLKEKLTEIKTPVAPPMPPVPDYPANQVEASQSIGENFPTDDYDDLYDVIELQDTAVPDRPTVGPKAPPNVPVKSFVHKHLANSSEHQHPIKDASLARDRAQKFSYVN